MGIDHERYDDLQHRSFGRMAFWIRANNTQVVHMAVWLLFSSR